MPTSTEHTSPRRLAAILFADIVGYTSYMQTDEISARQLLDKFHNTLITKVKDHQGQVINNYGDGCLCTFDSAVAAVQCAKEVQLVFQNEPKVPVRIGLHSGDVFFEKDNAFGDSVNIAARIESIGSAGAVLFSKRIQNDIANQTEFQFKSLGNFQLKNVQKEIELFALTNEGLTVPDRKKMKRKAASFNERNYVALLFGILALLGLSVFGFWKLNSNSTDQLTENIKTNLPPDTAPKEDQGRRVAVMVFENQTMDGDLDAFGKMISDWITRGLMETGTANVISTANIQNQIADTKIELGANPQLAKATGVEAMLQGRYYLQEGILMIHANIVNTTTGEVLHALPQITGSRNNMVDLLNQLTQEVLSYWAVKKQKRFLQNPPNYEAYQEWEKGEAAYAVDFNLAEKHMRKAFEMDTTFYAPLLKLYTLYVNNGKIEMQDSLIAFMDERTANFTQWEKLRYEYLKARNNGEWLKAAQLSKERYLLDKHDEVANRNAGSKYIYANYPREGVEVLNDFSYQFFDKDQEIGLREGYKAMGYFRLGEYSKVIKMARKYDYPKTHIIFVRYFLKSLIRMDSIDAVDQQLSFYEQKGVFTHTGKKVKQDVLLKYICDELFLLEKTTPLERYVSLLEKFIEEHKNEVDYIKLKGHINWYLKDHSKALQWWKQEKIKDNDPGKLMKFHARQGVCFAQLGDTLNAQIQIDSIFSVKYSEPLYEGYRHYYKARVEVVLGKKEAAMFSLDKAVTNGRRFSWDTYQEDIFLKQLKDYPPFEGFVKPKG